MISKYSCSFTVIMLDYPMKFLLNSLTNNMGHITITVQWKLLWWHPLQLCFLSSRALVSIFNDNCIFYIYHRVNQVSYTSLLDALILVIWTLCFAWQHCKVHVGLVISCCTLWPHAMLSRLVCDIKICAWRTHVFQMYFMCTHCMYWSGS